MNTMLRMGVTRAACTSCSMISPHDSWPRRPIVPGGGWVRGLVVQGCVHITGLACCMLLEVPATCCCVHNKEEVLHIARLQE